MMSKRISFSGTGFVGLIGAACFAEKGFQVIASDPDRKKIDAINQCETPFYERHLKAILDKVVPSGHLRGVLDRKEAVLNSDVTFIAVGTPMKQNPTSPYKQTDLRYIEETTREIGSALALKDDYHLVVTRSTVPPGTTRNLVKPLLEESSGKTVGKEIGLCMNPEFLREGEAVNDIQNPDRVVIGHYDKQSGDYLEKIYRKLYTDFPELPYCRMSLENAELVKYTANCLLATKISFANEIANISERVPGADIQQVMDCVGLDFRINPRFLRAGAGFGGSCFPKDINALAAFALSVGHQPHLLEAVLRVNENQPQRMVQLAQERLGTLEGKTVAVLGLAFKPYTNDMREAPSIRLVRALKEAQVATIRGYDPVALETAKKIFGNNIDYSDSVHTCLKDADACFIVTEWSEFTKIDLSPMRNRVVIDGRREFQTARQEEYVGIGLGK